MDDLDFGATTRGLGPGQKVFNRYTLKRILGRGGMGVVWLAHDESLEQEVAIKVLPEIVAADPAAVRDLKRETRRSQQLSHPHILRIYDFVEEGRLCGITMEYVDGGTLTARRLDAKDEVFQPAEIGEWVRQLAEALTYAHERAQVVHRDLKPANLMLTSTGDLKVADFGISASVSDSVSRVSVQAGSSGTPVYMSPQQMMGEKPAVSDDIYGLGATIYELLTGKPPFHSGNIIAQVQGRVPPSVAERRMELGVPTGQIPPVWEQTLAACLAKEPATRPARAIEVAERLGLAGDAAGVPIGQPPPLPTATPVRVAGAATRPEPASEAVPPLTGGKSGGGWGGKIALGLVALAVLAAAVWWVGVQLPAQRAAEAEERRLAAARGGIIVRTEPAGAEVRVGALALEESPVTLREVRLGSYPVVVKLPGYEDVHRDIEVRENEFTELNLTLVRATGVVNLETEVPGVAVEVWSDVAADSPVATGITPWRLRLPTGDYRAVLRREGWLERTVRLEVRDGQTRREFVDYGTTDRPADWYWRTGLDELRAAAEAGEMVAMMYLGDRHATGRAGRVDYVQAAYWYEQAAEAGSAAALAKWGNLNRPPIEMNVERWQQAARRGDPYGVVSWMYLMNNEEGRRWGAPLLPAQVDEALAALRRLAAAGDDYAQTTMSGAASRGLVPGSSEITGWLRQAADAGNAWAMSSLGYGLVNRPDASEANLREGMAWLERAAALGEYFGMYALGRRHEFGLSDLSASFDWYRRAADAGSQLGMYSVARAYSFGRGTTKDEAQATQWYRRAAEHDHQIAINVLGVRIENGTGTRPDLAESVKWYRRGAELGNATSMSNLAWMYFQGRGVEKDEAEAVRWWRRAADQGQTTALYNLGLRALEGEGMAKNERQAITWLREAADEGHVNAIIRLGRCYLEGLGVERDAAEAVKWFRQAADRNDAVGINWLASCHYNGQGVEQDYAESFRLFNRSAELGSAASMGWVALHYETGHGVEKDEAKALEWRRRAARAGDTGSQNTLKGRNLTW